jgi:hypothetical protein
MNQPEFSPALPDKKIPVSVILIGTFELAVALFGLILLILLGRFGAAAAAFLVLALIYGAIGAGLLAIQEWARRANVALHVAAVPYALYAALVWDGPTGWRLAAQVAISAAIVYALTRPAIRFKFQTAAPKKGPP